MENSDKQPFKTSKPFTAFSEKMKKISKKAIDCANKTQDKRFKALYKATESAISAVEYGAFDFKHVQGKACEAYFKESPCKERLEIINETRTVIVEFTMDVKQKKNEQEILCLDYITAFLQKFEAKKMYTYETALNQIANLTNLTSKKAVEGWSVQGA